MAKMKTAGVRELEEEQVFDKDAEKIDEIREKLDNLENRVQLLEIIAKKQLTELEPLVDEVKKVIQINAKLCIQGITKSRTYFCATSQEQHIFSQNNPGVETETFNIELPVSVANEYLNKPENKEQFTKKENINA